MKHLLDFKKIALSLMCAAFISCSNNTAEYYKMINVQDNTAQVLWNPADYDFEAGNNAVAEKFRKMAAEASSAGACSAWRNGNFHGRNLDWYQGDYGCLIIQMPKGENVKHASVSLLNSNTSVTKQFIQDGVISEEYRKIMPCTVVDGINDAGVAININIVPHDPASKFNSEGDLSSQCVVRYVLDNAGSVAEAIELLGEKKIRQDIVKMAGDETHYMISDSKETAVVEFDNGNMVVTKFANNDNGCYSEKGTPAIMTNLYDFAVERWGIATPEFYDNHPYAMGVERWESIKLQYDKAAEGVESNYAIAQSVWYFKNFMADKLLWYTENAIPTAYGKDSDGWFYISSGKRTSAPDFKSAQQGYWDTAMEDYWARYDKDFGNLTDPHVKENKYWETSHTVIYDLKEKKGYLYPFENFYSKDGKPIVIKIPE